MSDKSDADVTALRHRVNQLIYTHHPDDRGPYSNYEIADLAEKSGHPISATAIQQFRSGARSNPTFRLLRSIAAAYEVPVTYFFETSGADAVDPPVATRSSPNDGDPDAEMLLRAVQMYLEGRGTSE